VLTSPDVPITPAKEPVPPDVLSPQGLEERASREELPPGEERHERRGAVPMSPPTAAREEPPAGEESPARRTPKATASGWAATGWQRPRAPPTLSSHTDTRPRSTSASLLKPNRPHYRASARCC
jgi:hypothetical protein